MAWFYICPIILQLKAINFLWNMLHHSNEIVQRGLHSAIKTMTVIMRTAIVRQRIFALSLRFHSVVHSHSIVPRTMVGNTVLQNTSHAITAKSVVHF